MSLTLTLKFFIVIRTSSAFQFALAIVSSAMQYVVEMFETKVLILFGRSQN